MSGDHNMNQKPVAWFHEEKYKTHFTTDPSDDMIGEYWQPLYTKPQSNNDFKPDWDTVKAYDEKFAEMLDEIQRLRAELKQQELHDPIVGTKTWFSEDGKIIQQELRQSDVYEREWVGLTDEEIIEVLHPLVLADLSDEQTDYEIARAIEAKLKEKNG
jgi:hypothetical protein